ncbi:MAG: hypothetical protein H6737_23350 [Alphaproteobacteria bacterium]|nr:hypothetical protein [Alphaproteobacteria bacterium]
MIALLALCAGAAEPVTLPSRPAVAPVATVAVPGEVEPLRALLLAYHDRDLPGRDAILANGGLPALRWLATHEDRVGVRVRALRLLATHGPDAAVCTGAIDDAHPKAVVAAGLACLSALPPPDAAVLERVRAARADADPRVAGAAKRAVERWR